MATSARTGMPVSAETIAVHMATPALGPSFGSPSGTCIWKSFFWWKSAAIPSRAARERTTVRAALMDSRITSPSLPVHVVLPLPDTMAASIVSSSPPTSVQARPVTCPT